MLPGVLKRKVGQYQYPGESIMDNLDKVMANKLVRVRGDASVAIVERFNFLPPRIFHILYSTIDCGIRYTWVVF